MAGRGSTNNSQIKILASDSKDQNSGGTYPVAKNNYKGSESSKLCLEARAGSNRCIEVLQCVRRLDDH